MKLKYLNILSCLLFAAALTLSFSCSEDGSEDDGIEQEAGDDEGDEGDDEELEDPDYTYPESVVIDTILDEYTIDDETSEYFGMRAVEIERGSSLELSYTYSPDEIDVDEWSWSTSDDGIVNVDIYGKVIGSTRGSAIIKVSYAGSSRIVADSVLIISDYDDVAGIEIYTANEFEYEDETYDTNTIVEGKSIQLYARMTPSTASYTGVTWSSDNPTIASVDEGGTLTGNIGGTGQVVTISATSVDGTNIVGTYEFKVVQYEAEFYIEDNDYTDFVFPLNEGYATLTTEGGASGDVVWVSSDPDVAYFDDENSGVLTFVKLGETTVTAYNLEIGKYDEHLVKIPGGYFRELFKVDKTQNADFTKYDYMWFPGIDVGWWREGGYNGIATSQDDNTGGYLTAKASASATRVDIGCNEDELSFNPNYPYLVVHMDCVYALGQASSVAATFKFFQVDGMTASSDLTASTTTTNANSGYSKIFVWNFGANSSATLAMSGMGEYESLPAGNSNMFYRIDSSTAAGDEYNLYSVQTFASVADYEAYIALYK